MNGSLLSVWLQNNKNSCEMPKNKIKSFDFKYLCTPAFFKPGDVILWVSIVYLKTFISYLIMFNIQMCQSLYSDF